jgi:hypothetical protein
MNLTCKADWLLKDDEVSRPSRIGTKKKPERASLYYTATTHMDTSEKLKE